MKNTIKSIILPLIYSFSTLIVSIFVSSIYVNLNTYYYGFNTKEQITEYFNSDLYKIGINNFLTNNYIYIGMIVFFIFIPYLLKKYYKENKIQEKLTVNSLLSISALGILVSGIASIVFYEINNIYNFTASFNIPNINFFQLFIVTVILIPILEEYMFRGVIYNNLQKENNKMVSIIITSVLFALIYNSIDYIIYCFALSFLLIYVYEKYKSIKAPILLHIISSGVTLSFVYILSISNVLNYILLIIFIILLVIYYIFIIKKDKSIYRW